MPDRSGTLERIAAELGTALEELAHLLDRREALETLAALGIRFPPQLLEQSGFESARQATADAAAGISPALAGLAQAIEEGQAGPIVVKGLEVVRQAVVVIDSFGPLGTALQAAGAGLPGVSAAELARLTADFPQKLLELVIVQQLDINPGVGAALTLLGLIDRTFVPADPAVPTSEDFDIIKLRFDRLGALLTAPGQHFQDVYGWGTPGFDGVVLLAALRDLLARLKLPVLFRPPSGTEPAVLEAFAVDLTADSTLSPPGLRLDVAMPIGGTIDETVALPHPAWSMQVTAGGALTVGLRGSLRPPFQLSFEAPSATLNGSAGVAVRGLPAEPFVLVGQAGGSRLEVGSIEAELGLDFAAGSTAGQVAVTPRAAGRIGGGKLVIDGSEGDGFLSALLSGVAVQADFDLALGWSAATGVRFEGSATLEIGIPVHLQLGPLNLSTVYLILGLRDGGFPLELSVDLSAQLGPLTAVVGRMGARALLGFPAGGGNLGPAQLDFEFKPPSGVGLTVDAGVVRGGGFLFFDPDNGEYAGAIELVFSGFINLKAIGLIATRMPDGAPGFSLLIIITAEFGTGFQLGFGFVLLGVGGLLGLNRTMRLDALAEGVRSGTVNGIMFPRDVVANAPRLISDLRRIFPPENGKFLIGPMAKLAWGTPALVTLSLGIIIEIPGNVAIVGVLRLALPTDDAALVVIQVAFVGAIELDKQRLWFFASLFESRVLYITLAGEMGVLAAFAADEANFVLSVGGFHPAFQPPPLPFPAPQRISLNILNEEWGRIRVAGYFAVTSNTAQFGAQLDLFLGFSSFGIEGHLGLDALFQFSPFHFVVEISGSVSLKAFGVGVFSIRLHLALEGPAPWRARGEGSISFFFFSISADFDVTWGEARDTTLPPLDVVPLLEAELGKASSWRALLPPGNQLLVSLRALDTPEDLVLHPVGRLRVSQRLVPLGLTLDKVGTQKPRDANRFTLRVLPGGLAAAGEARESFAPAQFQEMDDASKLSRRSYETLPSGLELAPAGAARRTSRVVRRIVRYEQHLIDTGFRRFRRFADFLGSLFAHFLGGASVARSPLSGRRRGQLQPFGPGDRVAVVAERFVVAFQSDNKSITAEARFASEAEARQHLAVAVARNPRAAETMHVIPAHEAAA